MSVKRSSHRPSLCKVFALSVGLGALGVASSQAATVTLSSTTPSAGVNGVSNTVFATAAANNAVIAAGNTTESNYIAGDNANAIGQTFTATAGLLTAISVHQVSGYNTFYDYTGGNIGLQVFQLGAANGAGVYNITQLASETVAIGGTGGFTSGTLGANAQWLTFTLSTPLALTAGQYGFQITSDGTGGNGNFFIESDGSNTNPYAGGFAIGTGKGTTATGGVYPIGFNTTLVFDGNNGQISDRAFVATIGVPEPSTFALAGIAGAGLMALRRRRQN